MESTTSTGPAKIRWRRGGGASASVRRAAPALRAERGRGGGGEGASERAPPRRAPRAACAPVAAPAVLSIEPEAPRATVAAKVMGDARRGVAGGFAERDDALDDERRQRLDEERTRKAARKAKGEKCPRCHRAACLC